jgi:hypothetical protein
MSEQSLNKNIRTCKVDVSYSARVESDRFFNPRNLVCPVWTGRDLAGRPSCKDSFYTKRAGCNSAQDRVSVENVLRPGYLAFISDSLGTNYQRNSTVPEPQGETYVDDGRPGKQYSDFTGSFGQQELNAVTWPKTCAYNPYDEYSSKVL